MRGAGFLAIWSDVEAHCAAASPDQMMGTSYWAVLHFRRGGARAELPPLETLTLGELAYDGPADESAPLPKICRIGRPARESEAHTAIAGA